MSSAGCCCLLVCYFVWVEVGLLVDLWVYLIIVGVFVGIRLAAVVNLWV